MLGVLEKESKVSLVNYREIDMCTNFLFERKSMPSMTVVMEVLKCSYFSKVLVCKARSTARLRISVHINQ